MIPVLISVVALILLPIVLGILAKEAEGLLAVLPFGLLRLARLLVPSTHRALLYEEWSAELYEALHDKIDRPLTRVYLGIRYSVGLIWAGRRVARELGAARSAASAASSSGSEPSQAAVPVLGGDSVFLRESPAMARRRLRIAIREAREARGLTQRQVADALEWSLAKVNRIESGEVTVSGTDLLALLRVLDIFEGDRIARLTTDARISRRRGWWDAPEWRQRLTQATSVSLQYEIEASMIRSYHPTLLAGLLQTPAYAAAIVGLSSNELSEAERVEIRTMRRQQLFGRPDPPTFLLLLDEMALLREVGGPEVMTEQLNDLLKMIDSDHIAVRVLPLTHPVVHATGGFVIYAADYEECAASREDFALYRELGNVDEVIHAEDEVRRYRRVFDHMWERALSSELSIRLIEDRAMALRSGSGRPLPCDRHGGDGMGTWTRGQHFLRRMVKLVARSDRPASNAVYCRSRHRP